MSATGSIGPVHQTKGLQGCYACPTSVSQNRDNGRLTCETITFHNIDDGSVKWKIYNYPQNSKFTTAAVYGFPSEFANMHWVCNESVKKTTVKQENFLSKLLGFGKK